MVISPFLRPPPRPSPLTIAAYFSGMNSVSVTATKSGARWLLNRDKKLTEMPNRWGREKDLASAIFPCQHILFRDLRP